MSSMHAIQTPSAVPQFAEPVTQPDLNPQQTLIQAGLAFVVSASLQVFVKLRLPDRMAGAPTSAAALAEQADVNEEYLFRILRVMEMNGIVRRTAPRVFALTQAGLLLRSDAEGSLADPIEWLTSPLHLRAYGELAGSVTTGTTTFDHIYGEPFFHWLPRTENSEVSTLFNDAMTGFSNMCIPAFLEAFDFGRFTRLVDVGGGHGAILRSILKAYPTLHGVVAEMASVVPETLLAIASDGLSSRCDAVECNFFESVPGGGDAYFMKHIVHDWEDSAAIRILRNIRQVIPPDGRLILAECVLDEGTAPHPGKLLDIEMMVFVGGKERTEQEFRNLLASGGFRLERVVATASPLSLLEASPA